MIGFSLLEIAAAAGGTSRLGAQADGVRLPQIQLWIVDENGAPVRALSEDSAVIQVVTDTIPESATAKSLVMQRHIFPDAGAFAWIYSANPYLTGIDSLRAGRTLNLPSLQLGSEAERAVSNGEFIRLVVEPQKQDSVRNSLVDAAFALRRVQNPNAVGALRSALRNAERVPLDAAGSTPDLLDFVRSRAERIGELARAVDRVTPSEGREIVAEAAEYSEQLRHVSASITAGNAAQVTISVNLVYDDDNSPASGFALRWQEAGPRASCISAMCGAPFQLSTPKPQTRMNIGADYFVWAVRSGKQYSCDTSVRPVQGGLLTWDIRVFRNSPPPQENCK